MVAQVDLVLNGIVYCLKGTAVTVDKCKGKFSIVKRTEKDGKKVKVIRFKVSNDLVPTYFTQTFSYPQA